MSLALKPLQEGETLHSNLSRYAEEVGLETLRPIYLLVFGKSVNFHNRILPNGIERFCEEAKHYWQVSPAEFVTENSGYFYYLQFASAETCERARDFILKPPGVAPYALTVQRQHDSERFAVRYCAACVADQKRRNIEPYLSVRHQLPGVFLCAEHSTPLRSLRLNPGIDARAEAVTIRRFATGDDPVPAESLSAGEMAAALDVACRSVNLLRGFDDSCIGFAYEDMLREAGFLTSKGGTLNRQAVWEGMKGYFGEAFCVLAGLEQGAYMRAFWRPYEKDVIRCPRPLRYLALQSLLEYRASQGAGVVPLIVTSTPDIEKLQTSWAAMGLICEPTVKARHGVWMVTAAEDVQNLSGRYPCEGSLHRKRDGIDEVGVKPAAGRLMLSCTCGRRVTFGPVEGSTLKSNPQVSYGERYKNAFVRLVNKGCIPNVAARQLNISSDLAFTWKQQIEGARTRSSKVRESIPEKRERWTKLFSDFPEKGLEEAKLELRAVYSFLRRYDVEWLRNFNNNLGELRRSEIVESRLREVDTAYQQLISIEPPVWITAAKLRRASGVSRKKTATSEVLDEFVASKAESNERYYDRTIDYWIRIFVERPPLAYLAFLRNCHLAHVRLTQSQQRRIKDWLQSRLENPAVAV
ncbi:TnsD family Tn7-like transposition protein [Caballeronia sp. J97]|uniref:TnsD family Tn7-like transposition protein n=1 Tax=Caballeronia sp. J97 TaxID=2805429 RepID=UPI002AB01C2E|nr:TnsD family Tn7-like transposition protein [Caballeronia sp. J97]